ncbi:MAG: hypothetical protein H6696_13625 [Deferribacteres bacterium]|nr:hypothetical protein [candidate division KSB1 bacterium]MCB9502965.1 hypothetical protein [Deferribacteres bacterium]
MQIFDIHTHLLPGIDDGSPDWDETMRMVYQAYEDGTTDIAITHHILSDQDYARESEILEKFEELKTRVADAQLGLKFHLAAELFYHHEIELNHKISTFNDNKKYFLVEFPMQGIPRYVDDKFFEFIIDKITPILAHPERNLGIINKPERAFEFVQRGVMLQMNAGSLNGDFGEDVRAMAESLLDARLIHFVGSDGHDTKRRPIKMKRAYHQIVDRFGQNVADSLFRENPAKAMQGLEIRIPEPMPVEPPKTKKGFGLFKKFGF